MTAIVVIDPDAGLGSGSMRRVVLTMLVALGLFAETSGTALAKHHKTDKGTTKLCSGSGRKRKCHRVAVFSGHNAAKSSLRTEPLTKPSGDIWVHAENFQSEIKVNIYKSDGTYDEAALAQLDEEFRCKRSNEVRAVRPELYEQLSRIYDHFGGKRIELVSGFRYKERSSSRHFHASAMDIRVKDVSIDDLYAFAETLDMGHMGIGIYPKSQFVHVDYRAPGEPSYRWTDRSPPGGLHPGGEGLHHKKKKKHHSTGHTQPARKSVS
jgi:uncharacterized protein YcbK (DUF882 family)